MRHHDPDPAIVLRIQCLVSVQWTGLLQSVASI